MPSTSNTEAALAQPRRSVPGLQFSDDEPQQQQQFLETTARGRQARVAKMLMDEAQPSSRLGTSRSSLASSRMSMPSSRSANFAPPSEQYELSSDAQLMSPSSPAPPPPPQQEPPPQPAAPLSKGEVNSKILNRMQGKHQPVDIGMVVHSISNIDVGRAVFDIELSIYLRWRDPFAASDPDMKALQRTLRPQFANGIGAPERTESGDYPEAVVKEISPDLVASARPMVGFANAIRVSSVEGSLTCYLSPNDGAGFIRSEQRFSATFRCEMAAETLPFDLHKLEVVITLDRLRDNHRSFRLIESAIGEAFLEVEKLRGAGLPPGWRRAGAASAAIDRTLHDRSRYTVTLPVDRTAPSVAFLLWKGLAIQSASSLISLAALALPNDVDLLPRCSLLLALILIVATAGAGTAEPTAHGQWTLLGLHSFATLGLLVVVAAGVALHEVMPQLPPPDDSSADRLSWTLVLYAACTLWLAWHLWLASRLLKLAGRRGATYQEGASARGPRIAYEKNAKNEVNGSYARLKEETPAPLTISSDMAWG